VTVASLISEVSAAEAIAMDILRDTIMRVAMVEAAHIPLFLTVILLSLKHKGSLLALRDITSETAFDKVDGEAILGDTRITEQWEGPRA
jgi:hypothetical protein